MIIMLYQCLWAENWIMQNYNFQFDRKQIKKVKVTSINY